MRRTATVVLALAASSSIALAVTAQKNWMGAITGKDGAAITGMGMMMSGKEANSTEVTVEIKGDVAGAVRPWHVHVGSCAKGGGVFGGGRSYTPLSNDEKGGASSKALLAVAIPDTGSFYVNVHESAANMSKIVACGDLSAGK